MVSITNSCTIASSTEVIVGKPYSRVLSLVVIVSTTAGVVAASARSANGCTPPPDVIAFQPTTQQLLPSNFLLGVMYSEYTDARGPVVSNQSNMRVPLVLTVANVDLHEPRARDRVPGARFTMALSGVVTVDAIGPADSEAPRSPISLGVDLRDYDDPCFGAGILVGYDYRMSDDAVGVAVYDENDRPVFASLGGAPVQFTVADETERCFAARAFDLAGNFSLPTEQACTTPDGCSCRTGASSASRSPFWGAGILLLLAIFRLRRGRLP